jgi:hypothetical protein
MRSRSLLSLTLVAAAAAAGYLAWSGYALALPVTIAFPALWSNAPGRRTAILIALAYFLAASRGLPAGVAAFFQTDIWPGLILWLVASIGFVFVHGVLWSPRRDRQCALRYSIAMVVMAVPPFGIVGWAHPITAAGILFPQWGLDRPGGDGSRPCDHDDTLLAGCSRHLCRILALVRRILDDTHLSAEMASSRPDARK